MARINLGLAEGVAREALKEQKKHKESQTTARILIACLSVLLLAAMVCGTIIATTTIREQQYALNMQYAGLMELMSGAEVTTETTNANADGDDSVAIVGDNNNANKGELDGE